MPRYTTEIKAEAQRLYLEKELSAAAVAASLGLKSFTVKEWLSAAGVIRSMSEAAALSAAIKPRTRASSRLWYSSTKTGERHFAESSLEFLRMEQLDADAIILTWDRCRTRIPYVAPDGIHRRYVPDLMTASIDGHITIEELKPKALLTDPTNVAKFAACRLYCRRLGWKFRVLTEADVGYVKSLAPSSLSPLERRDRANQSRQKLWANQTPAQRADRLAKNASYMRDYNAGKRRSV